MALSYEPLNQNTDVTTTRTLLHEIIPLTGTIIAGTYGTFPDEENIKNFTHGMFQSVYDYPYLSSSANHIFDVTCGYDESSIVSASTNTQNSKKINLYNQFSQILLGYDAISGNVEIFESDLDITDNTSTEQMKSCFFISLSRLLTKDQIKKGSFSLELGRGPASAAMTSRITLQDLRANVDGTQVGSSIGGDYGVLYDSTGSGDSSTNTSSYGVVFYQAGIVVLSSSIWDNVVTGASWTGGGSVTGISDFATGSTSMTGAASGTGPARTALQMIATGAISGTCSAIRNRIYNLSYNNTTEINSTIYFCRAPVNKFNYSANPTYVNESKIRVKQRASDTPMAYVTTIGLYNVNNELLATAKLSEPLKKDPSNELTLRVRLDY
tara:strand:+ start:4105 stop:5250 length:1146 start_codon:yes stop_codon:yes gene_type:complete